MNKKIIIILCCAILSVSTLSACSGKQTESTLDASSYEENTEITTQYTTAVTTVAEKKSKITQNITVGYSKGQLLPGKYKIYPVKNKSASFTLIAGDFSIKEQKPIEKGTIISLENKDTVKQYNTYIIAGLNSTDKENPNPEPEEESSTYEYDNATLGELNALKRACDYINTSHFSASGLKEQLKYEGYTDEEAQYGVDNCGADWNIECYGKAKQYLNSSAFSKQGLKEQLEYEGFTESQIDYALSAVGY